MTTKVEPTVEKWERELDKINLCGCNRVCLGHNDLKEKLRTLLSLSVQEAKAEERQVMITKLHNIRSKIHGYISLTELTDLLASLKQEEEQ